MFKQKCFIRKNTPELVKKLEEMGYNVVSFGVINIFNEKPYLLSDTNGGIYGMYDIEKGCIDCGTNTELFIAIASLRDDTDNGQWQVADGADPHNFRKMTVQELIEHFNK